MSVPDKVRFITQEFETRDPFKICRELQIKVFMVPLVDLRGLYLCEEDVHMIFVSSTLSDHAASFVCGHELAHYIYDKGLNRPFLDKYTYLIPNKFEKRADMFSAHLHWGEPPLFEEISWNDWEIAECLNVPVCNVDARLLELGIKH
jgi:Zn-dependent peptidase ImmA (M78 family)